MEVFDDTFIPPGLERTWAAGRHCPRCVWPYLHPTASLDGTHLVCESCGHCWRIEHGGLRPVDPLSCHGCATRARSECIELLRTTFPSFGAGAPTDGELQHA